MKKGNKMFNQKPYALFFRTAQASDETPPEARKYQCDVDSEVEAPRGTKKQIRELVKNHIPVFIDKIKINEMPVDKLPVKGVR